MRRLLAPCLLLLGALLQACAAPRPDALPDSARAARFVLLGELHDNPEHHRARAEMLRSLLADGRPTRVLFEQMSAGTDAAIAAAGRDAEAVATAGRLDRRAWRWPMHKPLIEAALEGGATVGGANLEREQVRSLMRGGAEAAPPELRELMQAPWSAQQQGVQEALIDEGHCGLLPPAQLQPMVTTQRARDAEIAKALLATPPGHRAVLIAGNGHVRDDVGVPHYLRAAGVPASEIVSVGMLEADEAGGADGERAPFAITRTTPPAERPDPCIELRKRPPSPP